MNEHYLSPALARRKTSFLNNDSSDVGDLIHSKIWKAIFERRLRPGTKLPEDQLGRSFSVSRTVVRRVMIIMEQEGVVSLPSGRGAFVASPNEAETREIFEILRLTTCHLVRHLASRKNFPAAQAKLLKTHYDTLSKLSASEIDAHYRLVAEFFILLAHLHGNHALTTFHEKTVGRVILALMLYQNMRAVWPPRDHLGSIIDLIISGKPEQAVTATEKFVSEVEGNLYFTDVEGQVDISAILMAGNGEDGAPARKKPKRMKHNGIKAGAMWERIS